MNFFIILFFSVLENFVIIKNKIVEAIKFTLNCFFITKFHSSIELFILSLKWDVIIL